MSTLTFMYQKFQEIHNMVCSRRKRGEIMTRKETYESRTEQFLLPSLLTTVAVLIFFKPYLSKGMEEKA